MTKSAYYDKRVFKTFALVYRRYSHNIVIPAHHRCLPVPDLFALQKIKERDE